MMIGVQDPQMRKEESVMEVCLARKCCMGMSSWEFICDEARYEWSRACNFHRGADSVALVQTHQLAVEACGSGKAGDVPKKSCEKMVIGGEENE